VRRCSSRDRSPERAAPVQFLNYTGAICSAENRFFAPVVSYDEISLCSSAKSKAKAHPDVHHFQKVLFENDLQIKLKPNPENFKLGIYTIKLSEGLPVPSLVRLSL
jgi:hypothetical protein